MSEHACEISLQCPSAFLWKDLVPGLMPRRLIQFQKLARYLTITPLSNTRNCLIRIRRVVISLRFPELNNLIRLMRIPGNRSFVALPV